MKEKTLIEVKFQDLTLEVQKDDTYEWLLDTKSVAEGYGVSANSINQNKKRNPKDFIEGKHFTRVTISHSGLRRIKTFWTKKGVIRLVFFVRSDRGLQFRDWAEDLILGIEKAKNDLALKDYFG